MLIQIVLIQRDRNDAIIGKWIDQWRERNKIKKLFKYWKSEASETAKQKKSKDFCQAFYERGLLYRSIRHWKLFSHVAGNRMHERRMKERITIEVKASVEARKKEL